MTNALLDVRGLTKHYGGVSASDDIAFSVADGEIFGVIGPNGAGKTTLFNLITGFENPDHGTIVFGGRDITALRPDQRNRAGIARTFQILKPFPRMTVEENVMAGALPRTQGVAEARERAGQYIELVGLAEKRHALGRELSTGQRKRLEMARAMATQPTLLLLDEVTGGVDQPSIPGLIDLVGRLRNEGVSIMVIEHNMRVLMELADRVMFLNLGRKLAEGLPTEVVRHPEVTRLFLGSGHA
jgi:branched-chain amino acid transport system ATP-binding protein